MYVSGNWYMAQRSKSLFGGNTMLSRLMQLLLLLVSGGTDGLPKKETKPAPVSLGFHSVSRSYLVPIYLIVFLSSGHIAEHDRTALHPFQWSYVGSPNLHKPKFMIKVLFRFGRGQTCTDKFPSCLLLSPLNESTAVALALVFRMDT